MADYYYSKLPGYVYTYTNTQNIYNSDGTVKTLTGAPDYVTTLGFDGFAPNGDSMYRIQVTYQLSSGYATQPTMDLYYVKATNKTPGGYISGNTGSVSGYSTMLKRPRPVSTDTILAGVVGRIRTLTDDFSGNGSYVWKTDTLWLTCSNDSVYIWENLLAYGPGKSGLQKTRCIFTKDFINNTSSNSNQSNVKWIYDDTASIVPWGTNTSWQVATPDFTITVPAGAFAHSAKVQVSTPGIQDAMDSPEYKVFTYGVGLTQLTSSWYVTSDGTNFTKQDYTHSLVSVVHQ
jgi:hypothetical protein